MATKVILAINTGDTETTKESIKTKTESGDCFCIRGV